MPTILLAAMIMAQAPAAAQPAPAAQSTKPIDVNGKKKPKEKCEYMEVTGSHTRQRVCRDEYGYSNVGPNVSEAAPNPGMIHAIPGAAKGGFGGVPQ